MIEEALEMEVQTSTFEMIDENVSQSYDDDDNAGKKKIFNFKGILINLMSDL